MTTQEEYIPYKEAERRFALSRTTLWRLVNRGDIQASKVGKAVRLNVSSIRDYLNHHPIQPQLPGFDDVDD